MRVQVGNVRIHHLYNDILSGQVIVPDYQREYCWSDEKINLFIDSLDKSIPTGVLQFRTFENKRSYEVVDGLHRIRTIFNILLGRGIYYNFEEKRFTTNPDDYDYSKFVNTKNRLSVINLLRGMDKDEVDFEISKVFSASYEKVYFTELLKFEFEGSDEEVKIAFDRINEQGVTFTPTFNKVESETILTL